MDAGRYQVGQEFPAFVQCTGATAAPDRPSTNPVVSVFSPAGALVHRELMAADMQGVVAGVFRLPVFLGAAYAPGRWAVSYQWRDSGGANRGVAASFEIVAGGHADGAVIALRPVRRPNAVYLIQQTDSGVTRRGKNPR